MIKKYFLLIFLAFLVACQTNDKQQNKKLTIVCTTGMIADGIRNIAGDSAIVLSLMGEGVDPHLYKATTGDLEKLYNADIIFYNGLHLEGRMVQVLEKLSRLKPVIPISNGIPETALILVDSASNTHDPHIWFDVEHWADALHYASLALQKHDSLNGTFYENNTKIYLKKLTNLDSLVASQIAQIPDNQRLLITSHDAFSYFGKQYHIEVKGLQGISTAADFGLKDVSDLVKIIVARKIRAIFVETSVSEKSIDAVVIGCKAKGHQVIIGGHLYTDAMGANNTFEGTYIGMMQTNVKMIVAGLR